MDENEGEKEKEEKINCISLRRHHSCVVQNNVPYNTGLIVMIWVPERLELLLLNQ